jgi:hypothetical protein
MTVPLPLQQVPLDALIYNAYRRKLQKWTSKIFATMIVGKIEMVSQTLPMRLNWP